MNNFKDFGIKPKASTFTGDKIKMDRVLNKEIKILAFKIDKSKLKPDTDCLTLQIEKDDTKHVIFSGSTILMQMIKEVPQDKFPFITSITKMNDFLEFT